MTETHPPTNLRIRWGWFIVCLVLGSGGILVGLLVSPIGDRPGYVAGVLGGVGTTLLLVGIVVLLERRIVDTAVRVVRDAAEEARLRNDAALREEVRDLEARIAAMWASSDTATDAARNRERTRQMTEEFTDRIVEDYSPDDTLR